MKMTQTLFLPSKSSQFSQRSRKLRGEVEGNVNAALGACEKCQESPATREHHFSWGNKGRFPGGGGVWVFQMRSWKVILGSVSKGIEGAVHLCGWIVDCVGVAKGSTCRRGRTSVRTED